MKRTIVPEAVHHIYQRTVDGVLLFYTVRDHLVHFSVFSVCARRYGIKVLGFCQMPDHLHLSVRPSRRDQMSGFMKESAICFVKEYNSSIGRSGPILESCFGSAPKIKDKRVRENVVYLYNNPVERGLCMMAEDYQWNFLAYAWSDHPFSEPFIYRRASWKMKKAVRMLKDCCKSGNYLRYHFLDSLFEELDQRETAQLIDMIINLYQFIDYNAALSYYGSMEKMLSAIHSNTGTEHDIREVFDAGTDRVYIKMAQLIRKGGRYRNVREVTVAPVKEKIRLFREIQARTGATGRQIAKFLHLPFSSDNTR